MVCIWSSSNEFYIQVEIFILLSCILYASSRFQHAGFIFVVQVLHSWLSLIHSKLHAVYFSLEFYITNSTTFIFNSTTGIELHASVTSKG